VRPDPNGTQTPAGIERDIEILHGNILIYLIFVAYRNAPEKILLTKASPLQTPSSFAREKASGFNARD
jgi:hypothetical protein